MFGALPVPTRVGSFDSAKDMMDWLQQNNVTCVVDASHAFDDDISTMAGLCCTKLGLRYLRVLRPPWTATPRDRWQHVGSVPKAMGLIPEGARVFTNTGFATLADYEAFVGETLFMRQTRRNDKPAPFPFVRFIAGQPPFSQFQEERLFEELKVTHLICRNVGGAASMSKLLAARALQLRVLMIDRRPVAAHLPVVETVVEALAWEANA